MGDDGVNALAVPDLREDKRPVSPHRPRVAVHHAEVRPDRRRKVGLVNHQQVGLGDAGASLAGDFIPAGNVNDVNGVIGQFAAEVGGQVVPAGFNRRANPVWKSGEAPRGPRGLRRCPRGWRREGSLRSLPRGCARRAGPRRRMRNSASSFVKISLVTAATTIWSRSRWQRASISAVFPLPTGPPTPTVNARFRSRAPGAGRARGSGPGRPGGSSGCGWVWEWREWVMCEKDANRGGRARRAGYRAAGRFARHREREVLCTGA